MKRSEEFKVLNNEATALFIRGDFDKAEQKYLKAIEKNPKSHTTINNLGFLYAEKGDYDEAIKYYEQSLAINPTFATAHLNMGVAFMAQQKWTRAKKELNKACAIDESNYLVWENLTKYYLSQGDYDNAEHAWRNVIAINGEDSDGYVQLAIISISKHEYDHAEDILSDVISRNPRYHLAYTYLGIICGLRNNYGLAIDFYTNALGIVPEDIFTRYQLALSFLTLQQLDKAARELERILLVNDRLMDVKVDLAVVYLAQNRLDESESLLDSILSKAPDCDKAMYYKAAILLTRGKKEKAVKILKGLETSNKLYAETARQLLNDIWAAGS